MSRTNEKSGPAGNPLQESAIRALLAGGKSKSGLDNAKQLHKMQNTPATEALLVDAYLARVQALRDQNLVLEAKSLIGIVTERFPAIRGRLDAILAATAVQEGDLTLLLKPLNDPQLAPDARAGIEEIIRAEVTDLAARQLRGATR